MSEKLMWNTENNLRIFEQITYHILKIKFFLTFELNSFTESLLKKK